MTNSNVQHYIYAIIYSINFNFVVYDMFQIKSKMFVDNYIRDVEKCRTCRQNR